jgi:tetratricopeptide (TPR) repeat protein
MTNGRKAPDLYEQIRTWVYDHLGVPGLVLFALALAAFYVWRNWEKVKKWPGVDSLVAWFTRQPVPLADPHRFSVLVAHLENDINCEHERLIIEALKEVEGVQVLALDRTITLAGPVPEEMEKRGHTEARGYLQQSRAEVLIWGTVLRSGSSAVLKLYWTPSHGERKPQRYAAPLLETHLQLPEVFWSDLADILRLLVVIQYIEFRSQDGHFVADQLPPFIARVRRLLQASAGRPGWDPEARTTTRVILADALNVLGEQSGQKKPLEEAVAAYRLALQEYTRERVPLDWAMTQNNLGNALARLGEREKDTKRLEEAVDAFRLALEERTRERVPLDWAMTQNNLGNALSALGERESGTKRLEEAVDAFRLALQEWTRERVPLDWALTQNNLGIALRALGEREEGTKRLEEAVAAYRLALEERTRERVPLKWAATQNNLGNALSALGERESGTKRLEEAVAAYRLALEERTRERVPLDWAMTQNNLGNALSALGERESGTKRLEEAVAAFQAALTVFEPAQAIYYVEMAKDNLRRAQALLQERRK